MSTSPVARAASTSFGSQCPCHRGVRPSTCSPTLATAPGLRRTRLFAMPQVALRLGAVLLFFSLLGKATGTQPAFEVALSNISVPKGRDATFSCVVTHLGGYRVGWVKADTKAIQAIHSHVITHNQRVSVSHSDRNTWMLHIRGVQEEDRGPYMCQINTDPMKSQIGYLEVTVPPEIVDERSSNDLMVPEGSDALLKCRAKGHPKPTIIWQREDQKSIVLRTKDPQQPKVRRMTYEGEVLNLTKITRSEMGPYLCIANNSVPPIVSKRIMVEVHFTPVIHVPNQLIGAPPSSSVRLECNVEASPKSIQYWTRHTGEMLITNERYNETETHSNYYVTHMTLVINKFLPKDEGTYYCTAKNSLGEVQGDIKVYAIEVLTKAPPVYDYKDDVDDVEGDLGQQHTPEITNEIPHGPYSWEGTSPSHLDDVTSHHGYVTHPRTNQRPPSEPSLVSSKKKSKGGGGRDLRPARPTRPPNWGWNHPNSSLGVQTHVAFSSILLLSSVLLALLLTHTVI